MLRFLTFVSALNRCIRDRRERVKVKNIISDFIFIS